ncbi:WD40/YVTN/BNR-like repeat-containing protein [Pyxidicoccus sp. 3LFB2]
MNSRNTVTGKFVASMMLALGTSTVAHAHAGLPETSNVTVRRGHPADFFVGATFGAVISRDSGQTWRWICDQAMGYGGWRPESFLWREAGDIIAATGSAILRSPDGGCSWNTHPYFAGNWVAALAAHPTDDRILYAITGRTGLTNGVYRSQDGGETWEPTSLLRLGPVFNAIRVSPVDPRRLYVSGEEAGRMLLFRSDDAGATWQEHAHTLPELTRPYDLVVTAADPASVDAVWVRVASQGYTHLMRSEDGGRTLTPVHALDDVFINMELSADGGTVWVGTLNFFFRGPRAGPLEKQPLPTGNACVLRTGNTLYACGSTWLHDWALARSPDQGTTWEPLFTLYGIQGTHHCPAGTPVRKLCPALWPTLADQLGADPYPDGGVEEPPPPPPPPVDAGTPDAGPQQPDVPDAGGTPPAGKSDGCGAASGNAVPALVFLSTLTLWRRGRRRSDA